MTMKSLRERKEILEKKNKHYTKNKKLVKLTEMLLVANRNKKGVILYG